MVDKCNGKVVYLIEMNFIRFESNISLNFVTWTLPQALVGGGSWRCFRIPLVRLHPVLSCSNGGTSILGPSFWIHFDLIVIEAVISLDCWIISLRRFKKYIIFCLPMWCVLFEFILIRIRNIVSQCITNWFLKQPLLF